MSVRKFKLMPVHRQWTWNIYSLYKFCETPIFRSCKSWDKVWKKLPIFDEILSIVGHNFSKTDEYHVKDKFDLPWTTMNCCTNKVILFQWIWQRSVNLQTLQLPNTVLIEEALRVLDLDWPQFCFFPTKVASWPAKCPLGKTNYFLL